MGLGRQDIFGDLDSHLAFAPTRSRPVAVIVAAGLVVVGSAIAYLHPALPGGANSSVRALMTPTPAAARLQELEVVSGQVSWALTSVPGVRAHLYSTRDGGRTWQQLSIPAASATEVVGIQVLDALHGWLSLIHGLLATSDGGKQWTNVSLPSGETFGLGARFITPSVGWYTNLGVDPNSTQQPTAMWWTTDAGESWSQRWRVDANQPKAGNITLEGIKLVLGFRDTSTGWLTIRHGATGDLFETSDAGQTWLPVTLPMGESALPTGLHFLPRGALVLTLRTASGSWAVPSQDGGQSWEPPRPLSIGLSSPGQGVDRLAFIDLGHWAVADGPRLQTTSDAGRTWKERPASLPKGVTRLHDLWLLPHGSGWATGDDTDGSYRLLHTIDGGARWSLVQLPS